VAVISFPNLFSQYRIRHVALANRIVSTAHGTYMPNAGLQTQQIADYHAARAGGGVGLIILEATSTHPTGIGGPKFATAHTDACIPGYRMVFDAIHAHGTPAFVQLYHPGRDDIAGTTSDGTIGAAYSAFPVLCETNQLMPRPLSPPLIREIVESYGAAARRLILAGADGLEISAHHGHLIAQFLDPRINQRMDDYGGDFAGRFRILTDIVSAVREAVGAKPIVGVRLTSGEGSAAGITTDEALEVAVAVDRLDQVDFIHVTPGSTSTFDGASQVTPPMMFPAGYANQQFANFRERIRKPLLVTGRINDPALAEALLKRGDADLVGMTRALICDPEMPVKARDGRAGDIRFCIACNQACIGHYRKGGFVSCIQNPVTGRERAFATRKATEHPRRVLVAGGGPGGMKAAIIAAEQGHSVTLYERGRHLGGQARLAERLPGRADFGGLITNLQGELRRTPGVAVTLNQEVTRELIDREAPAVIVIATGATPYRPRIPGDDELNVVHAWDVVAEEVRIGSSVIIADATLDWVALGVAEKLAREGHSVRICSQGYTAGENTPFGVKGHWLGVLHSLGVQLTPLMRLGGCGDGTVYFQHATSQETVIFEHVDSLVLSYGGVADLSLEQALAGYPGEIHSIGDCLTPRTAEEAVLEGLKVASKL
jgi:2,4-dienoyl-CoA reductase-like NADH-dependent reductase (Old Yellow Enzyme family)